ncbi:hypothetical protein SOVF_084190 [Spinacia oleracea]|nr:hypothetical protein SOVF_084190 [Spinacia oleracea]
METMPEVVNELETPMVPQTQANAQGLLVDNILILPETQAFTGKRSTIWKEYMKLDSSETKDGKEREICKHCKIASFIANSHYGTTNMRNHIQRCEHYLAFIQRSNTDGETSFIYDQKEYSPEGSIPHEATSTPSGNHKRKFDYFATYDNNEVVPSYAGISQLQAYLGDAKLERTSKLDILNFWKENEYKSSTLHEHVGALITTRSWLVGYEMTEDDDCVGSFVDWGTPNS